MSALDADIVVVGAGAAGLAACVELDRASCDVICLEARDRLGGRIYTVHDPLSPVPLELGAEFIHGRPPEVWDIVRQAGLRAYDCTGDALHFSHGSVTGRSDTWELVGELLDDMKAAADRESDRSFAEFLRTSPHPPEAKEWAASYVEGFNAADRQVIGIASLAKDTRAGEAIDGNDSFRILSGYDSVPQALYRQLSHRLRVRLNCVVTAIAWRPGFVEIQTRSALTSETETFRAQRALLTLPLGVLQAASGDAAAVEWNPLPAGILEAARALRFGQVFRLVLRFAEPFWETNEPLKNAGFLLSQAGAFPTWWTTLAVRSPILTGWSAGPRGDKLIGDSLPIIVSRAIESLSRIIGVDPAVIHKQLQRAYFHDWHADPFARGAYSYVPAGALAARETLANPVENTLYFAGEATELNGHSATVHGAIASGRRAARQILAV